MHKCDNCGKVWTDEQVDQGKGEIPHYWERVEPGGIVPSGECPDCGALVYPEITGTNGEPSWASIRIDMLEGTDNKSANRVFGPLENYLVALKVKGQPVRDVMILEVGCEGEGGEKDVTGFLVHEADENGDLLADKEDELIDFSDVESIGVY